MPETPEETNRQIVAQAQRNALTLAELVILDAVDRWHDNKALPAPLTSQPLHEYLGATWEQYKAWVEGTDKPAEIQKLDGYLKLARREINQLLEERAKIWREGYATGLAAAGYEETPPTNPYEESDDE